MRRLQTLTHENKTYFIHQETELYFLVSKNGKDKIFSISKTKKQTHADEKTITKKGKRI